jgi:DNA end-binding protein Ku
VRARHRAGDAPLCRRGQQGARLFPRDRESKPDEELLDLAETLISKKASPFDPAKFHDRYIDALKDLIERKRKGHTISTEDDEKTPQKGMNVVDLMAALKKSISKPGAANDEEVEKKPAAKKAAPAKKAPARKAPAAKAEPAKKRAGAGR